MQNPIMISLLAGGALFLFVLFFASIQYNNLSKRTKYGASHPEDWLFHNFHRKAYYSLFGKKNPEETATSFGIKLDKYYSCCALTRTAPELEKLVMFRIYGIVCLTVGIALALFVSPYLAIPGLIGCIVCLYAGTHRLYQKAEEMRMQVREDLPRFLDILDTVIDVGFPVDTAIYIIAGRFNCLLSREFQMALNEMRMGISGWAQALSAVAAKYNVETLNDFVMEVTTAYSKGSSIADAVHRKTVDIRKVHLLNVKEGAGKMENTVMFPIALFQIAPLIAFLLLPTMVILFEGM